MRMIEKEIIERNNRFVTKSDRKNAKVELLRKFMVRILFNFLKKFPFRLFQFRPLDANDREGNNRRK